jgi:hypothetical protein
MGKPRKALLLVSSRPPLYFRPSLFEKRQSQALLTTSFLDDLAAFEDICPGYIHLTDIQTDGQLLNEETAIEDYILADHKRSFG